MFKPALFAAKTLLLLVVLVGLSCSSHGSAQPAGTETASPSTSTQSTLLPTPAQTAPSPGVQAGSQYSVEDLVSYAQPAVVRIATTAGVGSGFLASSDGYIVTNAHVVTSFGGRLLTQVQVTLDDGTVKTATVVGADTRSDMALVKIDGSGFPFLKIGTLENTRVGQPVVAIGYALDLSAGAGPGAPSVTLGIISAKNRSISESTQVLGAIQTDAAINPGNSGGPLLNLEGQVVGVNTAIVPDAQTGAAAVGIGLAVGADTVQAVFEQLRDTGKVNRGQLGIQFFEALRPAKAKELGVPADAGGIYLPTAEEVALLVGQQQAASSVAPGGPADRAGIRSGDVITKIADGTVRDESELAVALIEHHAGETVNVEIYRGGKSQTVQVTLGTPTG